MRVSRKIYFIRLYLATGSLIVSIEFSTLGSSISKILSHNRHDSVNLSPAACSQIADTIKTLRDLRDIKLLSNSGS